MRKIGTVVVSVMALGAISYFLISNKDSGQKDETKQTENTTEFLNLRPSTPTVSSDVINEIATDSSSSQEKINETKDLEIFIDEEESTYLKVNNQLLDAYYGDLTIEEKNKVLKNILSENLHDEYLLSEHEGVIFYDEGVMFEWQSFHNQQEDNQMTVINILEMVSGDPKQRILVTVGLEFNSKWLISDLKFELIYG